jgi:hypothetical protein
MKRGILIIGFILCWAIDLKAQPNVPDNPNLTPLDGGASLLIASGLALGAAQYRKQKINKV